MSGKAYIKFSDPKLGSYTISLGTVTSITNTVQKNTQITPIVSLDMQSGFPIESGNSQTYSLKFVHMNGQDDLTNADWYNLLTRAVDRWQSRTDGCVLTYIPDDDVPVIGDFLTDVGGYIKNLTRTYSADYNEMIQGTLDFTVGSMYINHSYNEEGKIVTYGIGEPQNFNDMSILLSDSSQNVWYAIAYGAGPEEYNLVDTVSITAGVESPFEKVSITLPKKKLFETIPNLKGDLIDNQNRIAMNCMGEHSLYLDKAKVSGDTVVLTGITLAQKYQQALTSSKIEMPPLECIKSIVSDPSYGVAYSLSDKFITNCTESRTRLSFGANTSVWRVLQICATILGARIFFADNKVYLIKYFSDGSNRMPIDDSNTKWDELVDLHGKDFFRMRVVSDTEVDPEGFAPVKNIMVVSYTDSDGTRKTNEVSDQSSVERYGRLSKGTVQVPELNGGQALEFAKNHLRYIREPQKSITFTLKEGYGTSGKPDKVWRSYFGASAQVGRIMDRESGELVTNISDLYPGEAIPAYNKLILSSYTRNYPKLTCRYTFGTVANVSLAENTSQVTNTLNVS